LNQKTPRFFVVMGVSGCGKTTVGKALAAYLDCPFYDGDDFHSPQNVAKMASGVPLNDEDRAPWLASLAALIREHLDKGETGVLASSALKRRYRDKLRVDDRVQFVFLDGDFDLIWERMQARPDHYMKAEMLQSQFETLEVPDEGEAITIPIDRSVEEILAQIIEAL
jgi:carbohydrate kinase (thermoresistant glucokinase family)